MSERVHTVCAHAPWVWTCPIPSFAYISIEAFTFSVAASLSTCLTLSIFPKSQVQWCVSCLSYSAKSHSAWDPVLVGLLGQSVKVTEKGAGVRGDHRRRDTPKGKGLCRGEQIWIHGTLLQYLLLLGLPNYLYKIPFHSSEKQT